MGLGKKGWYGRSAGQRDLDLHDMSKYDKPKSKPVKDVKDNVAPEPVIQPTPHPLNIPKDVLDALNRINIKLDTLIAKDAEVHKQLEK